MLRLAALLFATYVGAFVLTSAVAAPHELRAAWMRLAGAIEILVAVPAPGEAHAEVSRAGDPFAGSPATTPPAAGAGKAAALARPARGDQSHADGSEAFEIVLLATGALAVLDREGRLVLRHDPAERTTTIARGARLPRMLAEPAGDEPRVLEPQIPVMRETPGERDRSRDGEETLAVGCEGPVSPLARGGRALSSRALCLASL
ncbi:MAG: hypothetical protein ACFE0R_05180 [Salinarimonas sp.]